MPDPAIQSITLDTPRRAVPSSWNSAWRSAGGQGAVVSHFDCNNRKTAAAARAATPQMPLTRSM